MSRKAFPKESKKSADSFYDFYLPCLFDRDEEYCFIIVIFQFTVHSPIDILDLHWATENTTSIYCHCDNF